MKCNIGGELYRWNGTRFGSVFIFLQSFWDRKDKFRQWMASEDGLTAATIEILSTNMQTNVCQVGNGGTT
jgi:hypothetical protein